VISQPPNTEAMNARLLEALDRRDAGEDLSERETRIVQMHAARDSCPSTLELAGYQVQENSFERTGL